MLRKDEVSGLPIKRCVLGQVKEFMDVRIRK
jgi:hypothetical protein